MSTRGWRRPSGTLQEATYITSERVAYSASGVWHMEPGVETCLTMYYSASERGVCAYLADHPHFDPENCCPSLVVWAAAPHLSPEDGADGKLGLFRGQRQRFGAWPQGIGFSLWLVDACESDQAMAFDWADFLRLAESLADRPSADAGETLWRTIASRAYCACFHTGLAAAMGYGCSSRQSSNLCRGVGGRPKWPSPFWVLTTI